MSLLALVLLAATPAPAPPLATSPQEIELLLGSIQPAQRAETQTAVRGLGSLPLYRVVVRIEPAERSFHGQEQLRVPLVVATPELALRVFNDAKYLNGGKPPVVISGVHCPDQPCKLVADADPTLVHVQFDPPLPAGALAAVDLDFDGEVPALPASATNPRAQLSAQLAMLQQHDPKPTDHGAFGAGGGVLALTGMFPQLAAHFAGAVDLAAPTGVGDVASYDLSNYLFTATVPASFTVVAAGARVGEEAAPSGEKRFTFAAAAVRDFPIYAGDGWKSTSETRDGLTVTAYTLQGDEASGKVALGVASRALADFSKRFGPYPWTSLSVVEQPLTDGAGGIEYPTVIGVASMLYRGDQNLGPFGALFGKQQKLGSHATNVGLSEKMLETAVAHEVAHQWWSILVGSDPHRNPVVDEPLAQYSAALYVESVRGKAAATEALSSQVAVGYQTMRLAGVADGPAARAAEAFDSPLQYAGLIYGKAPLFYQAVRKELGERDFAKALRHYADKFRFGEAGPHDFMLTAAQVAPAHARALNKLEAHWLEQAHGDADIGPLDFGKLLESATGMKLSAQEKAMFQQLAPQLTQMLQSGVDPSQLLQGVAPQGP